MMFQISVIPYIFASVLAVLVVLVSYFKWLQSYWERKNFHYLQARTPWGNFPLFFKNRETFGISLLGLYNEMKKKKWRHGGIYVLATPHYVPIDLELIKHILAKDFAYFVDRGLYFNEKDDPLSAHLVAIGGTKWRNLRSKLTPTFTSGKMKMMFQTLVDCEQNLQEKIKMQSDSGQPIDIKEMLACFTTDIIGSCAFGLDCNSFKETDSLFRKYGKEIFNESVFRKIMTGIAMNCPNIAKILRMKLTPNDISNFFRKIVKDTVEYREKNGVTRKDFMQLLIDLKNNKLAETEGYQHDGKTLTIDEIAAQSFVFFLAGFETSSTVMTFAMYELAKNQNIQDRVRNEIEQVLAKYKGHLTYEGIQEMKFMQQVIDETMRKYPPVPFLMRTCVKDYKIPGENFTLEKGQKVTISVLGIHLDEDYYPNPNKFDPERFNEENSRQRHQYAYLPFGEGPRLCIGMRFGLMQSKVGLTSLLRRYKFTVNAKTKVPITFQPGSFILAAEGDIWLDAKPII